MQIDSASRPADVSVNSGGICTQLGVSPFGVREFQAFGEHGRATVECRRAGLRGCSILCP